MPANPSAAQSAAARVNGARSNGPRSSEGKSRSSANATRHGLRASRLQLTEDERLFVDELRQSLAARVMPADAAERDALEALLICEVKLARLDELEMRALDLTLGDEAEARPAGLPSLSTLDRYRGRIMRERRELEKRLEVFKASRTGLAEGTSMAPQALRYLADLAECRTTGSKDESTATTANDNKCTNEPKRPKAAHSPSEPVVSTDVMASSLRQMSCSSLIRSDRLGG